MKRNIIFYWLLFSIHLTALGQSNQTELDQIFRVNKTPIWSYAFLRNTTKEFIENAKGLEQNLIGAEERLKNTKEKNLLLQQAIEMAEWNKSIAELGEKYAQQSLLIAQRNADVAGLRATNKANQITEGVGTLDFIKKKNQEIVDRNFWAVAIPAAAAGVAAGVFLWPVVAGSVVAGSAVAGSAVAGSAAAGSAVAGSAAAGAGFAVSGISGAANLIFSNDRNKNAMQERQIQDQINQMGREKAELDAVSQVAAEQIIQEQNAVNTAIANTRKAELDIKQAEDRYNLYKSAENLTVPEQEDIIELIINLRSQYIQYAIVLAKLTEKAYQAEEVTTVQIIKDNYTAGNTGEWLAADKILLDLNTIEFNRITQKKQKPNFSTLTISLNNKDPWQLELLRQRGVMSFDITQFELDLGFPGTYAQTIKEIDVTVIALTDPAGVKGQLTKEGLSWKKVPEGIVRDNPYAIDDWFKYVPSGYRAMIFDDENETLILPKNKAAMQEPGLKGIFEGKPICGTYTLELPKYSNSFDYGTIVDVVITINFASYYDETLKSMVETEICEMNRAEDFVNKRVMPVSMAAMQPDEWYELHNPGENDTLSHKRRYLPFFLRRNYFPTNQLNPLLNELSVSFVKEGRYMNLKFAATSASMNPGKRITIRNGQIDPLQLDTLQLDWFRNFKPLTNQVNTGGALFNDTIFIHVADSLLLSQKSTNMPDSPEEPYELWILKIESDSIPSLCESGQPARFDDDKIAEINDISMHFGYQFSNDFCVTSRRIYAYMDVTDDTTRIRAIDATMQKVPYLYVREGGTYRKKTQDNLSWYAWDSNISDNSFGLQRIIHVDEYADLVPFYSFLKAKTPIEEIEVKFDIKRPNNQMTLYCSPPWIQINAKRLNNDSLELYFVIDLNKRDKFRMDSISVLEPKRIPLSNSRPNNTRNPIVSPATRGGVITTPKYTFSNGQPAHLVFRYLNLADNSGRASVDIAIIENDQQGNSYYSRLFNKAPIFYRWRNEFETNFALRIDRDDNPKPVFILRDIKFSDFARY